MQDIEKEIQDAYFAGLIDGEGNIRLKPVNRGRNLSANIRVKMTDESVVADLRKRFGGYYFPRKPHKSGYKPQHEWYAEGYLAVQVIEALYKYLRVKKSDAALVLAHYPEHTRNRAVTRGRPSKALIAAEIAANAVAKSL